MYVLYSTDVREKLAVVFNTELETYTVMSLIDFVGWLDGLKNEIVIGVDVNGKRNCLVEVPTVGEDLCGNLVRYIQVLFEDYERRFRFKDGVVSIVFSDTNTKSFNLGIDNLDKLVGIYYVLDTVVGEPFFGLVFVVHEDGVFTQYSYVNGRLRLDAEKPTRECKMKFDTERLSIYKGGY